MFNLKSLIAVFPLLLISLILPIGNAFAINCDLPCNIPLPPNCEHSGDKVSFYDFTSSSHTYYGEVCHPNTNFNIYVTTHLFGWTISSYYFPGGSGAYNGTYLSGHPYYKIELVGDYHPNDLSSDIGLLSFEFINDNGSTMLPQISIQAFDDNNNLMYSGIESPPNPVAPGAPFPINILVTTGASQISHIHINTIHKHGISSIKFTPMSL